MSERTHHVWHRRSRPRTHWRHDAWTEALSVLTVRRNAIAIGLALVVALIQPWLFVVTFQWLNSQAVAASAIEVIGLSNRNQGACFLIFLLLGIRAYCSDAAHGILQRSVAEHSSRVVPALNKLLFGLLSAAMVAGLVTLSNWAAVTVGWQSDAGSDDRTWLFWPVSLGSLVLGLSLYFLLGLVIGGLFRTNTSAVVMSVLRCGSSHRS